MKREARSIASRDCLSRATPHASQTRSDAIGRPQIASVSRTRRASGGSASSRVANISANVGAWMRLHPGDACIACQLLEHERTAAGLARHATPVVVGERRAGRKQCADQRLRLVFRQRIERDRRPDVAARALEQRPQERLGRGFFAPEGQQREHGRRARRPKQFLEQHDAVGVGPLQVVDADDERPASSRRAPSSSRNASNARRRRANGSAIPPAGSPQGGNGVHLQEHGEDARQRRPHRVAAGSRRRGVASDARWRLRSSTTPSSALYGTDSFS